nr:MAG TPA: Helix-turn-helix XRE-family like protein [Caudoviricetes sp.]
MNYEMKRIKQLCHDRGWSLYRLAHEMNASPNNIYNIFRRSTTPSVPTLRQVCKAFDITMAEFYTEDGNNDTQDNIYILYNRLSAINRARAEAYMMGLSEAVN